MPPKTLLRATLTSAFAVSATFALHAQQSTTPPSAYVPTEAFAPLSFPDPVNAYRSANGAPGPYYWQKPPRLQDRSHARPRRQDHHSDRDHRLHQQLA